ncbi:MAG: integrase/recombinase XerD [Chloroflexota bacterium]|nr:integrase/recombinase XerD [Chloroflexota bacterium]
MATVGELRDDYVQRLLLAGRSEHTVRKYVGSLDDFERFAARHQVSESSPASKIDRKLIGAYQLDLSRRHNPDGTPLALATRNVYGSALRGLLRHGVTVMGLDVPAPDTVVLAKVGDQTTRHLEVHEFQLLVDAIPKDSAHRLRDRALLEVLFATGCRLSELCGLTRRRVNLKTREVEVIGKGKKARGTFLTDEAADWLQRYLNTRRDESPHVFISSQSVRNVRDPKTGQKRPTKGVYPLSPRQVETIVSHLALRAGLPEHFSPHWFRHGRLTIMARHSGLLAAQELAGHASPQTTRRYTRITSSELKKHFDDADREERRS